MFGCAVGPPPFAVDLPLPLPLPWLGDGDGEGAGDELALAGAGADVVEVVADVAVVDVVRVGTDDAVGFTVEVVPLVRAACVDEPSTEPTTTGAAGAGAAIRGRCRR